MPTRLLRSIRAATVLLLLVSVACVESGAQEISRVKAPEATLSPTATPAPTATLDPAATPRPRPTPEPEAPRTLVSEPVGPQRQPAPPAPAEPAAHRPRPAGAIGDIEIPAIGLRHAIYEGTEMRTINRGPGHHEDSAMPGWSGNAAFAGHRTTYSRPFRHIDDLRPGDRITYHMPDGTHVYEVYETFVVEPHEVWITRNTEENITTIYACHPPGSARYRYVVRARLLGDPMRSGPDPAPTPTPSPTPTPTPRSLLGL